MSINSMTDEALRLTMPARMVPRPPEVAARDDAQAAGRENSASSAVDKLIKYIPTESITLYVAAIAAKGVIIPKWPWISEKGIYWFFGCLTPVLWLLIYIAKRKAEKLPPLPPVSLWLVWNLLASFVAFLVWALAVPEGPYFTGEKEGVLAGFLAVFISSLLSMIELLIDKPNNPA
jgi:hypothetical protein